MAMTEFEKEVKHAILSGEMELNPIRSKYYLNNWHDYVTNIDLLSDTALINARLLFRALNELPEEDRYWLELKYARPRHRVNGTMTRLRDELIAEEIGITAKEYRKKRIEMESRFSLLLNYFHTKENPPEWQRIRKH